jgi:hypothetical protein
MLRRGSTGTPARTSLDGKNLEATPNDELLDSFHCWDESQVSATAWSRTVNATSTSTAVTRPKRGAFGSRTAGLEVQHRAPAADSHFVLPESPPARTIRRSSSMALGCFERRPLDDLLAAENAGPNKTVKRSRMLRRHSVQVASGFPALHLRRSESLEDSTFLPSLSSTSRSSSFSLSGPSESPHVLQPRHHTRQSSSLFDPLLGENPPNWPGTLESLSTGYCSPSQSAASSSKKRGYSGSPGSDYDEYMSSSFSVSVHSSIGNSTNGTRRRQRSRSRVFSCNDVPMVPVLLEQPPVPDPAPLLQNESLPKSSHHRRCMEVDSDDDHDSSSGRSTPNSSFDSTDHRHVPLHVPKIGVTFTVTFQNVLEHMPSEQDLKFLVKMLRKEKSGRLGMGLGICWALGIPLKWPPTRREPFLNWAKFRLGFDVAIVGQSATSLQISKTRGAALLAVLEEALTSLQATNHDKKVVEPTTTVLRSPWVAPPAAPFQ